MFREDSTSTWTALAAPDRSSYDVVAHGPYHVVVACPLVAPGEFRFIREIARTTEDDLHIDYACTPVQSHHVTARIQRAGLAAFATTTTTGSTAPWTFNATAGDGSFDLMMWFDDDAGARHLVIRRDISITGDTDLGVIDPADEDSEPMVPVSFTLSNLEPGETPGISYALYTGNTRVAIAQEGVSTWLAPEAALRANDRQFVTVYTQDTKTRSGQTLSRDAGKRMHVGDPTRIAFPPRLGPVTFQATDDQVTAAWTALPDYDVLSLSRGLDSVVQTGLFQSLSMTRAFMEATGGATSATLSLSSVPGATGPWQSDHSAQYYRLDVERVRSADDFDTTSASD